MRGSAKRKLGELIRRLRRSRNISQQALALALGVHEHTVARWERDGIDPRHAALPQIAAALTSEGNADADVDDALRMSALARVVAAYRVGLPSLSQAALGHRSR